MKVTKRIYNLLKENPHGLTIRELSDRLKVTRNTVAIGLAELRGEKGFGNKKCWESKGPFYSFTKGGRKMNNHTIRGKVSQTQSKKC